MREAMFQALLFELGNPLRLNKPAIIHNAKLWCKVEETDRKHGFLLMNFGLING